MKKNYTKAIKTFFNSKKNLRILISILAVIAIYYSVITSIYLLFLLPLIVMWTMGTDGVEFFNVSSSKEIQRTDISYFTTGDVLGSIKLLLIIAIIVFVIIKLMKIEKKLS
jgi:large-conductance mechanosensitive channel